MNITYIHHSSFLISLSDCTLLFDYTEGKLPEIDRKKPLFVFASHAHGDHFSPVIFSLASRAETVCFVLSDDISKRRVPSEALGSCVFVKAGAEQRLSCAGASLLLDTFDSTDEGVAFLLKAEDGVIYHAGDLNNWVWAGEPDAENRAMSARYRKELTKIADKLKEKQLSIDAAFVPLDPRQESDFYLGMDDFMRTVGAAHVFPMHFWGDYGVSERFLALNCSAPYRERFVPLHEEGEQFRV